MKVKYSIMALCVCMAYATATAQDIGQLPSQETQQEIQQQQQSSGIQIAPMSKPGGGPGLGEVETPINQYSIAGILLSALLYSVYVNRKKTRK